MSTLMQDGFGRTNTVNNIGTPDIGPAWNQFVGIWGIDTSQGYCSTVSGDSYCGADVAQADVNVTYIRPAGGNSAGIFLRYTNTSNNLVFIDTAGLTYYKKVAGSYTQIGSSPNVAGAGQTIEMDTSGNNHTCKLDGVTQFTATESFNSTATVHGLFTNGNNAQRWDSWLITGAAAGLSIPVAYHQRQLQGLS